MSETPVVPAIEYYAPQDGLIEDYATSVCKGLGSEHLEHEVMWGFTHFVKVLVQISVNTANRQSGLTGRPSDGTLWSIVAKAPEC